MQDLGFINASNVEFGLLEQAEALGVRFSDQEKQIIIAVASLSAAELTASLLYFAQQQIARLPEEERAASRERYKTHPRLYPIMATGMTYEPETNELVISMDAAALRFMLGTEAKEQLKELAQKL